METRMTNANPSPDPTLSLERRVQRLTAAVAVLAVGLALSITGHFLPHPQLDATAFVVRDAAGERRGTLGMDGAGNPELRLNDARGRAMLYGVVIKDGTTRLRLADTTGMSRLVFEVGDDRTPNVWLLDSHGREGLRVRVARENRPIIDMRWGGAWRQVTLNDSLPAR
jgi:hypothetical protein